MRNSLDNNIKILRGPDHLKLYLFETGVPDDPNDPRFPKNVNNMELTLSEWDSYCLALTLLKAIGFEVGEDEMHRNLKIKYKMMDDPDVMKLHFTWFNIEDRYYA